MNDVKAIDRGCKKICANDNRCHYQDQSYLLILAASDGWSAVCHTVAKFFVCLLPPVAACFMLKSMDGSAWRIVT